MRLPACPVCGAKARTRIFEIKESEVFQCAACGLRYLDPCLSPESMAAVYESHETLKAFHDFHEGYYNYGDLSQESKTRDDFEEGLRRLERYLNPNAPKKILDVGFGNGFFLAIARQRGWQVQGIDPSAQNLETAHRKFGLELLCGDFEKAISDHKEYDAVAFWDVIEHLPDPHHALQKARSVLKPTGFILIGIPNDQNLLMIISSLLYKISAGRCRFGVAKLYFLEHAAYYQRKALDVLLEKNHFSFRDSFFTYTDLAKYKLPPWEKWLAGALLWLGHGTGLDNRLVAIYQCRD